MYHQHPVEVLEPDAVADSLATDTLLVQSPQRTVRAGSHSRRSLIEPGELVCGIPPASGKLPRAEQISAALSRIGYQPQQRIIAFDDEGGGWAGRLCWTLDVIGHYDWAYLDGGLRAWHAAGLPLAQGSSAPAPTEPCGITIDTDPIAEIADIMAAIDDTNSIIWDVRSAEEFAGLRSGSARRGAHSRGSELRLRTAQRRQPPA